jgi:hypothetical protein
LAAETAARVQAVSAETAARQALELRVPDAIVTTLASAIGKLTKKANLTLALDAEAVQLGDNRYETTYYFEGFSAAEDFEVVGRRTGGAPFSLYGDVIEDLVPASAVPASIVRGRTNYFARIKFTASAPIDSLRVVAVRCPDAAAASLIAASSYSEPPAPPASSVSGGDYLFRFDPATVNDGAAQLQYAPLSAPTAWVNIQSVFAREIFAIGSTLYIAGLYSNVSEEYWSLSMTNLQVIANSMPLSQYNALKATASVVVVP